MGGFQGHHRPCSALRNLATMGQQAPVGHAIPSPNNGVEAAPIVTNVVPPHPAPGNIRRLAPGSAPMATALSPPEPVLPSLQCLQLSIPDPRGCEYRGDTPRGGSAHPVCPGGHPSVLSGISALMRLERGPQGLVRGGWGEAWSSGAQS